MENQLSSKIILITGSQGFLGKIYANYLISQGAKVIACDLINFPFLLNKHNPLKVSENRNLVYYFCDITDESSVIGMFNDLKEINFLPNSLINNAARNPSLETIKVTNNSRLEDFSIDQFRLDLEISLVGAFICAKHIYINGKKEKLNLNIVNISSDLGIIAPDQRLYSKEERNRSSQDIVKPISYSVSKHGIHGLTKYLATYDPLIMRSNTLFPGGVFNNQDEIFLKRIAKRIPQGRMANKNEYNGALKFLLSDDSNYMNGSHLIIDGGRTIW